MIITIMIIRCGQEERRICAEDTCVLVEGEEQVSPAQLRFERLS